MKHTLFALALLVPAVASAAVQVDLSAKCGEYNCTEKKVFTATEDSHEVTSCPDKEVVATVILKEETPEYATFTVKAIKGEDVLGEHDVKAVYGEEVCVNCEHEGTDASLTLVASQVSVTGTETE